MNQKYFIAATAALLLSACATTHLPAISQQYDPSNSARIRLFGQNGMPSFMTVEISQGKTVEVTVGGTTGDMFGSFLEQRKMKASALARLRIRKIFNMATNSFPKYFIENLSFLRGAKCRSEMQLSG